VPSNLPEKLYYYTSAESAVDLLQSNKIEGIAAAELDGTLELNAESKAPFDKQQLTEAVIKSACGMIFGAEAPQGDSALIAAIQRWRDAERFATEEEAQAVLQSLCSKMVDQAFVGIEKNLASWSEFCQNFRILRLYEKLDNFYLWQQHAQNFTGVVARIAIDEDAPTFAKLKQVQYLNVRPEICSVKDEVESIIRSKTNNIFDETEKKFLVKPPSFQKEKEWRSFKEVDPINTDDHHFSLSENTIKALYLGPAIASDIKEKIVSTASELHPKLKIAQLQFAPGRFDLSL
jgi:hypothetical protein